MKVDTADAAGLMMLIRCFSFFGAVQVRRWANEGEGEMSAGGGDGGGEVIGCLFIGRRQAAV